MKYIDTENKLIKYLKKINNGSSELVVSSFYARYGGADCAIAGSALPMQTQKAVAAACGGPIATKTNEILCLIVIFVFNR